MMDWIPAICLILCVLALSSLFLVKPDEDELIETWMIEERAARERRKP